MIARPVPAEVFALGAPAEGQLRGLGGGYGGRPRYPRHPTVHSGRSEHGLCNTQTSARAAWPIGRKRTPIGGWVPAHGRMSVTGI
jgi:hypothetical protein